MCKRFNVRNKEETKVYEGNIDIKKIKTFKLRVQIEKDIQVVLNNKNQDFNLIKMMIIIFFSCIV